MQAAIEGLRNHVEAALLGSRCRRHGVPAAFKQQGPSFPSLATIWRDVRRVTPLPTRKVVIHQTQSTLIVLGVGLVMFMLFTSGMSSLRLCLGLHAGKGAMTILIDAHQIPRG